MPIIFEATFCVWNLLMCFLLIFGISNFVKRGESLPHTFERFIGEDVTGSCTQAVCLAEVVSHPRTSVKQVGPP